MPPQNEDRLAADSSEVLPGVEPPTEEELSQEVTEEDIRRHVKESDDWKNSSEGQDWMEEIRGDR